MSKVIKTYWWRHGQTDWNLQRKWQGHTDIPLNETGMSQAQQLSAFFQNIPLDCIFSSDLKRAFKTAQFVSQVTEVEVVSVPGLREGHYGRAEGLTADEIRAKFGAALMEKWRSSDPSTFDMDFVGGETKRQIYTRVMDAVHEQLLSSPFRKVGISTHGGVLRKVVNVIDGAYKLPSPIPNCSVIEMDFHPQERKWSIVELHEPLRG